MEETYRRKKMSNSMYKHPSRIAKATPLQKTTSKLERKIINWKKISFKNLIIIRVLREQLKYHHYLFETIKKNDKSMYDKSLKECENIYGKSKKKSELKLDFYKENYHKNSGSKISGWIEKEINKMENIK